MARRNSDDSHKITRVVKVKGREEEGDKGLIVMGHTRTRVANRTGQEVLSRARALL
jgi:hypothetical protein